MGVMDYIRIDGVDSREFGLYAYDKQTGMGAKRVYEDYVIPGRNGVVKIDTKRYNNVSHTYDLICYDRAEKHIFEFRAFLMSLIGYHKLEDSFSSDFYYLACFDSEFEPVFSKNRKLAKVKIEFTRKPERYLRLGDDITTLEENGTILNPTLFNSKPLFKIYGNNGSITVNETLVNIVHPDSNYDFTFVDCESMECYHNDDIVNKYVSFYPNKAYPELHSGYNTIRLNGGVTKVEITPRWYMI